MNYSKLLDGKTAVITNGDCESGIAIARLFAEHGASVFIGVNKLDNTEKIHFGVTALLCDLADAGSVESFCAEINNRAPLVNVLVNNPWVEFDKPFEETGDADDALLLQVYQRSIVQTLRAFWPAMIKYEHCSVINISSSAVSKPLQGHVLQTMAFGAVGGMTRVPAVEGGIHEVRVNEIQTGFYGGHCEELANTTLFLASDMSSYISGITLSVSGGLRRAHSRNKLELK